MTLTDKRANREDTDMCESYGLVSVPQRDAENASTYATRVIATPRHAHVSGVWVLVSEREQAAAELRRRADELAGLLADGGVSDYAERQARWEVCSLRRVADAIES